MIDARWLDAFRAFTATLNFTRAARQLHLSQPALFAQVKRLEADLGTALYRRVGRTLVLTPAGEQVLAFARDSEASARRLRAQLEGREQDRSVSLAAGEGAFLHLLQPALGDFRKRSSDGLRLVTADRERALALVRTGEVDLAVTVLEGAEERLHAEPLTQVGLVVAVPKTHRLARRQHVAVRDLEGETLVVPPPGRPHRVLLERALRSARAEWKVGVEVDGWELMLQFARLGLGLAVVNAFCRMPPGLVARPMPSLPAVHYAIFSRRRDDETPGPAKLRAVLHTHADDWKTQAFRAGTRASVAR